MSDTAAPRPDWPTQAADTIVRYVDQIKTTTTDRALTLAKTVVYASFAMIIGALLGILTLIGLFRAADNLRELIVEDAEWLTYLVLGMLFVITGQVLFARRKKAV